MRLTSDTLLVPPVKDLTVAPRAYRLIMGIRHAAWVPEEIEQDWEEAAVLAARWVWMRAKDEGATPVLVANALDATSSVPALRGFEVTSPQSRRRPASGEPVLAYTPTVESLVYAEELARGSSLVVVEGFSFSVRGWVTCPTV